MSSQLRQVQAWQMVTSDAKTIDLTTTLDYRLPTGPMHGGQPTNSSILNITAPGRSPIGAGRPPDDLNRTFGSVATGPPSGFHALADVERQFDVARDQPAIDRVLGMSPAARASPTLRRQSIAMQKRCGGRLRSLFEDASALLARRHGRRFSACDGPSAIINDPKCAVA
jgi:hypothetical protein